MHGVDFGLCFEFGLKPNCSRKRIGLLMRVTVCVQWQGFGLCFQDFLAVLKPGSSVLSYKFRFVITSLAVSFWGSVL